MNQPNDDLQKLKATVDAATRMDASPDRLSKYVTDIVNPPLTRILRKVAKQVEPRHAVEAADFIVHYTGISTILSMLQAQIDKNNRDNLFANTEFADEELKKLAIGTGGSLRLYDSAHSNDPAEGRYLMQELARSKDYHWLQPVDLNHAYLVSFIIPDQDADKASDNLVFWRTYGREGEGISLKLKPPITHLRKVVYGGEEFERTIDDLDSVIRIVNPLGSIGNSQINQLLSNEIHQSLEKITHLYKSQAYQYESECRYVVLPSEIEDTAIKFDYQYEREASGQLRHYYEDESLGIGAILPSRSSITIGPCVDYVEDVRNSIERLVRRAGLLGPEIKPSKIVYRKS